MEIFKEINRVWMWCFLNYLFRTKLDNLNWSVATMKFIMKMFMIYLKMQTTSQNLFKLWLIIRRYSDKWYWIYYFFRNLSWRDWFNKTLPL